MGILEVLTKHIDDMEAADPEIIGGTNIKDVLFAVELSIAHTPVIPYRGGGMRDAVEAIETEGGGYLLRDCPGITHAVSADTLKRMRARYLLTKNAIVGPQIDAWLRQITKGSDESEPAPVTTSAPAAGGE